VPIGPAARTGNKFNSKPSMREKKTDANNEAKDSHLLHAAKMGHPEIKNPEQFKTTPKRRAPRRFRILEEQQLTQTVQ
jgi:hypothetical protein